MRAAAILQDKFPHNRTLILSVRHFKFFLPMEDNRSIRTAIKCCSTLVRLHSWERQPIRAGLLPRKSERKDNVVEKQDAAPTATHMNTYKSIKHFILRDKYVSKQTTPQSCKFDLLAELLWNYTTSTSCNMSFLWWAIYCTEHESLQISRSPLRLKEKHFTVTSTRIKRTITLTTSVINEGNHLENEQRKE